VGAWGVVQRKEKTLSVFLLRISIFNFLCGEMDLCDTEIYPEAIFAKLTCHVVLTGGPE
jgi:hypothetical protein